MMSLTKHFFRRRIVRYTPFQIAIAKEIYNIWQPVSVYDLGCGIGGYLEGFLECECFISGSELGWNVAKEFMSDAVKLNTYEFDASNEIKYEKKYDLVMCIEVAEHIEEKYSDVLCRNLVRLSKNRIVFSAALPGQPGTCHVNCQPKEYWIDKMIENGAIYDRCDEETLKNVLFHVDKLGITKNIMVFKVGQ